MKCDKCGAAIADDAAFCGECGAPLRGDTTAVDPPLASPVEPEPRPPIASAPAASFPGTVPGAPLSAAVRPAAQAAAALPVLPAPAPPLVSAAARAAARAPLAAGTIVDQKYMILRVLGEGGMGVVYLARDVHTGVEIVLKAIRGELAHRADVRERALTEGRALAQIDHPNVVHLNAVVVDGPNLWLVMQYIDGESLETTIDRYRDAGRTMPFDEALRIFRQIMLGIAAAHREGVIHRDLKPANILIRKKDGVAKVSDFGIAKAEADALAGRGQTKGIIGSLWYMSPEQVMGRRDLDKRVDIYSLGILLYQMLIGEVPFDAENDYDIMKMHSETPIPSVSEKRKDVPKGIDELIRKACAKDRDQRFATSEDLLEALDAASGRARPDATVSDPHDPLSRVLPTASGQRPRALWPIVVLSVLGTIGVLAALVLLGVFPGRRRGTRPSQQQTTAAPSSASATPTATSSPENPLAALAGPWVSENGRQFDAVSTGSGLEFRVRDPEQFQPQDYRSGEPRFVLTPIEGERAAFALEDRIRPEPPVGKSFDSARARTTCYEVWTAAENRPLRATFDGTRLSAEVVKIEPSLANFLFDGGKVVVGCRGLRSLRAARIVITLRRP